MRVEITSKQITISDTMRAKVEERFEKLQKLQTSLINPHFIITKEPKGVKIEGTIGVPNGKVFAHAEHDDLYVAITQLFQKIERQLNKHIHKDEANRAKNNGKDLCRNGEISGEAIEEPEVEIESDAEIKLNKEFAS
ncbi:ribosome-associated translation inhibitor RaiA [Psychromonas sp. RZ22]|uniref:ribosome hibernation-promoting factor, HPF/YfiA family n=1 Tax=Psychromonas algarum TaxID=2555643 RepID=UPI001068D168|nr:ribosome-associated translation inhibitor RaiA [Psychromonas sp. RZ22]TEW56760.1 ribosome-associated translation inhibitor RaiA [Psychromonas sp. RZ22]